MQETLEHLKRGNVEEGAFHLLHASLSTAAVGLFFFQPILCYLASSVSDLILNSRRFTEEVRAGNIQGALESLAFLTLDVLFIASFCYGAIEITVACMLLQILLDVYLSIGHFKKGEYFEGACQAILAGAHIHQTLPQLKVLHWKYKYNPTFTAELKQDAKGFVYLDIPDEYLDSLLACCGEDGDKLPPYFGKGRAGAHVSVILTEEMRAKGLLKIEDVGKKFTFRIVHQDSIRNGPGKISFLTVSCPELESVRTRHGFSPRIGHDHDFHITFAVS
jgi:hypothetical protein